MTTNSSSAAGAGDPLGNDPKAPRIQPSPYALLEETPGGGGANDIEMVMDVPVQITVELGRSKMQIRHLVALTYGAVIELDVPAGEPLDVVVNGTLVAQGEVVIVNDRYAIRLTDIVTPAERLRKLHR